MSESNAATTTPPGPGSLAVGPELPALDADAHLLAPLISFAEEAPARPIFAVREVGRGRAGLLPIYPSFLTGGCDHSAWNSMVWDGSAEGRKSDMKTLFLNAMAWLCQPSVEAKSFGGYVMPEGEIDYRPMHERPIPLDWSTARFREPTHNDYLVLIGMQSQLSGGTASPQEMIDAAGAAGYQVAVFAEPVAELTGDEWQQLCGICAGASGDDFLAIPGLRYRDPQGNSYLLFGTFAWPDDEWYAKCFNEKGEVIDTYALYAKVSGWRHVAVHSLAGEEARLSDLRGQVVLVNFWGTWGPPCLAEIPELIRAQSRLEPLGATVVGPASGSGAAVEIRTFAEEKGINYPIWIGRDEEAVTRFGAPGYPFTLLVDRDGVIRRSYIGPQREETLMRDVEALAAGS